ncbi:glycosyl transferase [Fibrobacterales bacterium]|nr:glycosyl transferase [Fibrobacterales bacterium]
MKILLVNTRYFISGGPERYMFNVMQLLESKGHTVIPFSVQHKQNKASEYSRYWLSPLDAGIKNPIKMIGRIFYSFEAKSKLERLIKETRPDLIYCLQYQMRMSCSVISAAKKYRIPFVQRISEYAQICPGHFLYNPQINQICEKCSKGSLCNAVKDNCAGSRMLSFVKAASVAFQQIYGVRKKIDAFVFTSAFTRSKFLEAKYLQNKSFAVPTFFNAVKTIEQITYEPFALFFGRLDPDKGVDVLVDAFLKNKKPLKIIGFSYHTQYEQKIKKMIVGKQHQIEFLGKMNFEQIQEILAKCLFTIVPSNWYENLPNSLLESYALKKCVVATGIGSLAEAVIDNETGLHFKYRDASDLISKADYLFEHPEEAKHMGENGYRLIETKYSAEEHYKGLMGVFEGVVKC